MIGEVLTQHPWLWPLAWQSTACLAAGLTGSVLLRRRPARAHQLLLLSLIAAILVPALSHAVKQNQWGLFVAERTVSTRTTQPLIAPPDLAAATPTPMSDAAAEPARPAGNPGTPAPVRAKFQWDIALPVLWLGVTSVLLLRLIVRLLLGLRLVRRSQPVESGLIAEALDAAKATLGIEGTVIIRTSGHACSPVIWCWGRKPVLLAANDSCDDTRLDWPSIVCHELAHWRRRDHISGLLAELMICLLPWQPFSWLARRRLVDLSEEACDDWVIASGQVATRYARTLLSLTPLGQAALIPAVVTSRTGLAGRVRRIIDDRCGNPRSGLKWTLATITLTTCIAVTIAFAQTRLAHQTGTTKIKTGRLASIEQLTPALTIKGRVLDPNGEAPSYARVVVLPVTSCGTEVSVLLKDNGYFELPWSPTWIDAGQNPCLMVADDRQLGTEAVLVEIADPTTPVTIHLKPAATIAGQVTGPNGQPLDSKITLSPTRLFRCPAPIHTARTHAHFEGKFSILKVPYGHAYKLGIHADGYQPTEVVVDTKDTRLRTIDIGAIVMQPQDPAKPAITPGQSIDPDLEKEFREMYRLDEGDIIKFIKPPFVLGREQYFRTLGESGMGSGFLSAGYLWDGEPRALSGLGGRLTLSHLLGSMLRVPCYDRQVPQELRQLYLPSADMVIRKESSPDDRLKALEEIIHAELHRTIRFEKRMVERDTLVVTGRYNFTPLSDKDPNRLCAIARETQQLHDAEANSLSELLRRLAEGIGIPLDDRTDPGQTSKIAYTFDYTLVSPLLRREPIDKEKDLPALLDNLAKQTGLQFKVEKQPAQVWFVTEKKDL